jgi:Caffeine-induced death protein 2
MSCKTFTERVLFPSWQARSDVLTYCTSVATSPDPNDPDVIEREAHNRLDRDKIVNERLDPYSGRHYPREARTEQLATLLRQEEAVERIIRTKTWGTIQDRCQGMTGSDRWEEALDKWREGHRGD